MVWHQFYSCLWTLKMSPIFPIIASFTFMLFRVFFGGGTYSQIQIVFFLSVSLFWFWSEDNSLQFSTKLWLPVYKPYIWNMLNQKKLLLYVIFLVDFISLCWFPTFHVMKSEDIACQICIYKVEKRGFIGLPWNLCQKVHVIRGFKCCSPVDTEPAERLLLLKTDRAIKVLSLSPQPLFAYCAHIWLQRSNEYRLIHFR